LVLRRCLGVRRYNLNESFLWECLMWVITYVTKNLRLCTKIKSVRVNFVVDIDVVTVRRYCA
jgi:hypothetical protein